MATLSIVAWISVAIVVALFVYYLIIKYREQEDPTDDTIFINFMSQYADGYNLGSIVKVYRGHQRTGIKFVPKDVDHVRLLKKKEKIKIEPQLVFYQNRHLISFPKGTWSAQRNEMWGLPPNPEDLPEELKHTGFGKFLMKLVDQLNAEETEVESIRKGSDNIRNIIDRQGDGVVSASELERMDLINQTKLNSLARGDEKKTSLLGNQSSSNI